MFTVLCSISLILSRANELILCPDGFEFLSYEDKETSLRPNFGTRAYIAFGRPEFYSISIISVTNREKRTKFQCHEDNLGKVINVLKEHDTIEMGKKGGFFKHGKPQLKSKDERPNVCCVCSLENAENIKMLLFPTSYTHSFNLDAYHSATQGMQWVEYAKDSDSISYDLLMLTTAGATCSETLNEIGNLVKVDKGKRGKSTCASNHLQNIGGQLFYSKAGNKYGYALAGKTCFPSWEICNTKNQFSLTVFILSHSKSIPQRAQYIKAAYSMTGIFDVTTLFKGLVSPFKFSDGYRIEYLSIEEFYSKIDKKVPPAAETTATIEWRLAAFCASCPETSIHVIVSEKKVISQRERVAHAMRVNVKANWRGGAGGSHVGGELGVGWSGSFMNELNQALSEGTSIKFIAKCNGFYLYHFDVQIGSKHTGFSTIPTRYFYCTDRPYPPTCVPDIAGYQKKERNTVICQGYDTDDDFGVTDQNSRYRAPWRSFHSGRPKPLKLYQNANEPKWAKPVRILRAS
eukprot:198317_1